MNYDDETLPTLPSATEHHPARDRVVLWYLLVFMLVVGVVAFTMLVGWV